MFVTNEIKKEYETIFTKNHTHDKKPITDIHRGLYKEVLNHSQLINGQYRSGNLVFGQKVWIHDREDIRFVAAADMAATFSGGLCYLISHDRHIKSLAQSLLQFNIMALDPDQFLQQIPNYYHV